MFDTTKSASIGSGVGKIPSGKVVVKDRFGCKIQSTFCNESDESTNLIC